MKKAIDDNPVNVDAREMPADDVNNLTDALKTIFGHNPTEPYRADNNPTCCRAKSEVANGASAARQMIFIFPMGRLSI